MKRESSDFELSFLERLAKDNPEFVDALVPLAEAYTRRGLYQEGLRIDKQLAKIKKTDPIVHYNLACSFALVGDKIKAVSSLKKAVKLGYQDFEHLKRDKDLEIIQDHAWVKSLFPPKSKKR